MKASVKELRRLKESKLRFGLKENLKLIMLITSNSLHFLSSRLAGIKAL
jgi:hypothetical protein